MRKLSKGAAKRLHLSKMSGRKETVYKYLGKKNDGNVPCFVCGKHVKEPNATLEHITPLSKGGSDEIENLSISHYQCNNARGNNVEFSWDKKKENENELK
jgi:5-methylcytosine-specific restriction endonuclease McrA